MKNYIKLTVIMLIASLSGNLNAQQITTTTPNITPVQAVEDILLGAGINAFNITYNGSGPDANVQQDNIQEFDATGTAFPIETGVLMSTDGVGNLNDPDLDAITGGSAQNGAIIEFDFVPTGDTLSFNYIFSSSEYTSFTCDQYNDAFGFFISGPGINGPYTNNAINIALVPGTNVPVSINTVNEGNDPDSFGYCSSADPNWQANSVYFTTSYNTLFSNSPAPMSSFNGSTVLLPAAADLVCNDTFHIKLAIANDFDESFDSGVFLEAKSFESNILELSSNEGADVNVLDSVLVENCSEGSITLIRPEGADPNDTIVAPLFFSGTATQGDDFPQLSPGDSITLLPGEDTVTLTIIPTGDGLSEGLEDITISTYSISACGDTIFSEITFYIADSPPGYQVVVNDTTVDCVTDSAYLYSNVVNGVSPFSYSWSNGDTDSAFWFNDIQSDTSEVVLTVTGVCDYETTDTATVILNELVEVNVSIESENPQDTLVIEGCTEGNITLSRFECDLSDSLVVYLITSNGTADEVDDYGQLAQGDSVIFEPGEDTINFVLNPIEDGVSENGESVIVTAYFVNSEGDTIIGQDTIWIIDKPALSLEPSDTTIYCGTDSIDLYVGIGADEGVAPYNYEWFDSSTDTATQVSQFTNGEYFYTVEVTDYCGTTALDSARLILDQTLSIDSLAQTPSGCGEVTGSVFGQGSGYTPSYSYEWSGPGANSQNTNADSVWQNIPSGWYYLTLEDDVCSVTDSIFVEQTPPPNAAFSANPTEGYVPLDVEFTNNSDPADSYDWDFGNGDGITVNSLSGQNTTYSEEGIYMVTLVVTEDSCTDQVTQTIIVNPFIPLSYDMPNVFTPNGDQSNDVFTLNTVNATKLELVILNRWGNVVYESSDNVNAFWNGKVQNVGRECGDGTYFYKFTIYGQQGEEIEEHGFVQLVRDGQ